MSQFAAVYRARWAVKIQAQAWKQAHNLGKGLNRKSNEHHLQALEFAAMIAHQLAMNIARNRQSARTGRSVCDFYHFGRGSEVFFKQVKQRFKFGSFLGHSAML